MGEVAASKRQAEHMAAKAAIGAEFPEELSKMAGGQAAWQAAPAQQKGQKRGAPQGPQDLKSKLMSAMQVLTGGPLVKADVAYDTKAVAPNAPIHGATFVSTL